MVAVVRDQETDDPGQPIEVLPVVVLSKIFPARPSSIPEIREFVRTSLADAALTAADNREISRTVFRALLDAAGPAGTIEISFRIVAEQVEVDVLHSVPGTEQSVPVPVRVRAVRETEPAEPSFGAWMSEVLRREGLTHQAAAEQLGVSVKTVGRWVGGETEPRLRDLRRIRERFGDLPLR